MVNSWRAICFTRAFFFSFFFFFFKESQPLQHHRAALCLVVVFSMLRRSVVTVCYCQHERRGLTDIIKPCLVYLYAKQRQGEQHQPAWCAVHRDRSNWTEGCWLRMCEIALQTGEGEKKRRDVHTHAQSKTLRQSRETVWELFSRGWR